jgi:hypothetical protein
MAAWIASKIEDAESRAGRYRQDKSLVKQEVSVPWIPTAIGAIALHVGAR